MRMCNMQTSYKLSKAQWNKLPNEILPKFNAGILPNAAIPECKAVKSQLACTQNCQNAPQLKERPTNIQ